VSCSHGKFLVTNASMVNSVFTNWAMVNFMFTNVATVCFMHTNIAMVQVEVFCIVTPCSVVVGYQRFRGPCCLVAVVNSRFSNEGMVNFMLTNADMVNFVFTNSHMVNLCSRMLIW
jgi:hypothetical protein